MTDTDISRRRLLALAGGTATTAALAGCGALTDGPDDADTTPADGGERRELVESFAPTLYFDAAEQWFPTDPRPYASERDGETVVDGFDALEGYTADYGDPTSPPRPTVFYRVVDYADSSLSAVQYWLYSAFDQFSTNFHWHDWEVVHVFVDRESGEPQLYVASAHSRKVPNNEFLDPDRRTAPRVLAELGSHSSALSVNAIPDRFQRLPTEDTIADITNRALEGVSSLADVPAAYGLPRDEGLRLPYLVPELDGQPVFEDDRLPSVDRSAFVPPELTVRSLTELASPPTDLPGRETGLVFGFEGADPETDLDVSYDLVPVADLTDIAAFTGPQLSFEFAVPEFAEDAIASHITTTGVPWEQVRYDNPAADISEPAHRSELADRYAAIDDPGGVNRLVAAVSETAADDDAPDGEGVTTAATAVELVALVESDPEAVPTFRGVAVVDDLPAGEHRLTVNGAGYAPHSERVTVTDDPEPDLAGVEGEVAVPPADRAVKLRVDTEGTDADLTDLAVEDDFGGRLYESSLAGPDAVYVDRRGAYTTEVEDADDAVGAFRVNPGADQSEATIAEPRTGKASLAAFVADVTAETSDTVRTAAGLDGDADDGDGGPTGGDLAPGVRGLARALDAVAAAARRAAARAEERDAPGADRALAAARDNLERIRGMLADARGDLPDPVAAAVDRRLEQADRRADQAVAAEKL